MYVMSFNIRKSVICIAEVTGVMEPREDIQLYDVVLSNGNTLEISVVIQLIQLMDGNILTKQVGKQK
jgi:hypothetical protein